jgi:hypothetical protein
MRKTLGGFRWLIDRWSMRRYERAQNRDRRRDERSAEDLQMTREGIRRPGDAGGI